MRFEYVGYALAPYRQWGEGGFDCSGRCGVRVGAAGGEDDAGRSERPRRREEEVYGDGTNADEDVMPWPMAMAIAIAAMLNLTMVLKFSLFSIW